MERRCLLRVSCLHQMSREGPALPFPLHTFNLNALMINCESVQSLPHWFECKTWIETYVVWHFLINKIETLKITSSSSCNDALDWSQLLCAVKSHLIHIIRAISLGRMLKLNFEWCDSCKQAFMIKIIVVQVNNVYTQTYQQNL